MSIHTISYLIFIVALVMSFVLDFTVFSKKNQTVSIQSASKQYLFWVAIAFAYFGYLWYFYGHAQAIDYLSAYFMEMSLSIDNIFVFVLIFSSLQVRPQYIGRVLMIGVILAIVFRIIFITLGIALINQFHGLLYVFGAFLIFTGFKMFFENQEEEADVREGRIYRFVRKYLPYTEEEMEGQFTVKRLGKTYFTKIALVVFMIGITDIVFALDSIPAVFAISQDNLIVYSSNIFAVLGLRALFFILQKAADQFDYLQQGIAIVLIFVGAKMFLDIINVHFPVWVSLVVIVVCIGGSLAYSVYHNRKNSRIKHPHD